jgi:hypoxanthine-DNA glycosylase
MRLIHPLEPFIRRDSRILILGSFPSVKSRESGFYYGNPQNRFWKLVAGLLSEETPGTLEQKQAMLVKHRIALWDVIQSCEIEGSSDNSIRNAQPTCITERIRGTDLRCIHINGAAAGRLFKKYQAAEVRLPYDILPSTSAANASYTMDRLAERWSVILLGLK